MRHRRIVVTTLWLVLAAICGTLVASAQTAGDIRPKAATPSAEFKEIRVDKNVTEKGESGIRIHVTFSVKGLKSVDTLLAIRFYNGESVLLDKDDKFANSAGQVVVVRDLKPGYETTDYNDLTLFMPWRQLDLGPGDYSLRLDIDLTYPGGELIQHLAWGEVEYSQGGGLSNVEDEPGTKINRIWIEYNVDRGGKKGMLVHLNFEVAGLKGVDALVGMRVRKGKDKYLESANAGFSNGEGEFEVTTPIKPGFDPAVYEDVSVFIPYSELVIGRGVWTLELDVDLLHENGQLIQHLDFHSFEFKRA